MVRRESRSNTSFVCRDVHVGVAGVADCKDGREHRSLMKMRGEFKLATHEVFS